jgi:hypothetical protein
MRVGQTAVTSQVKNTLDFVRILTKIVIIKWGYDRKMSVNYAIIAA